MHDRKTVLLFLAALTACDQGPASSSDAIVNNDGGVDADAASDSSSPPSDADPGSDHNVAPDAVDPEPGISGLVDWTQAGYPGDVPEVTASVIDVTQAGASCDGSANDQPAIQTAIDGAPNPAVILLPAATCRIEAPLGLKSGIVLRGRGSKKTHLECRSDAGCIDLKGSPAGDYVSIASGLAMGSTEITVSDASGFTPGGGAEIRQKEHIAAIDYSHQRYDRALARYEDALAYYQQNEDVAMRAVVLNGIGDVYRRLQRLEEARDYYECALVPAADSANAIVLFTVARNLGETTFAQQDYAAAETYYDGAQQLGLQTRDPDALILSLEWRGRSQQEQQAFDRAADSYEAACRAAHEFERTEHYDRNLQRLRDVSAQLGQPRRVRRLVAELNRPAPNEVSKERGECHQAG